MQNIESPAPPKSPAPVGKSVSRASRQSFVAAKDSRNRKIPGLYTRGRRYYGQVWAERGPGLPKTARRFPLMDEDGQPVAGLTAAREALDRLRADKHRGALPAAGQKPAFDKLAADYLTSAATRTKRARTQAGEKRLLDLWVAHLGALRVDRIGTPHLADFKERRLAGCTLGGKTYAPASLRTVALDMVTLRNVLKFGVDRGDLAELPRFPKVKSPKPPRRPLLTAGQFEDLLCACFAVQSDGEPLTKNAEQMADYLRFLAYTGAREQSALRVKWNHVSFEARRVYIGAPEGFAAAAAGSIGEGGEDKGHGAPYINFSPALEALLLDMKRHRASDCSWLFPSPQRGKRDIPARNFRQSLLYIRECAGVPWVGFHDLRHFFASTCIMAGVDFMTTARWLGHKDGGILVGKVYGHLVDEHRQRMADRLDFA
jgi:integrase